MDPSTGRRKPRLERRNANKNYDYDAASFSSSMDETSSSSSSLRTRSLEISDRTSFRIEGNDGDFDRICRSLGLTGIEDFAIPAAAWEARKIRSPSDLTPRSRLNQFISPNKGSEGAAAELKPAELSKANEVVDAAHSRVRGRDTWDSLGVRETPELALRDSTEVAPTSLTASTQFVPVLREAVGIKGTRPPLLKPPPVGIKGTRPPLLKPPPSMRIPVMDNEGSTWDILRNFAPDGERDREGSSSSSDDEEEKMEPAEIKPAEVEEEEDSGSFTASNDDASSSTTDPTSISPNMRYRRIITNWEKGELLGRGSFGSVYEGIAEDGFFFAIKEVSLLDQGDLGRQSIFQLEQEIALLSQFEHENIVRYYGTDKDESNLYIFLEFVTKGSLQSLYRRYHLRDSTVAAYTRQILHGLKYLHDRNVVHRDIKCANILVDASGSVKLADFGLAKATKLNDVQSCKGTACWMAPEVIKKTKDKGYGLPADIWSLGCTVLEMLTRKIPYSEFEPMQAVYRIGRGELPTVPELLSTEAHDFIVKCLQVNPNDRPTAARLLDHPFVKRPLSSTPSASPSPYYLSRRPI